MSDEPSMKMKLIALVLAAVVMTLGSLAGCEAGSSSPVVGVEEPISATGVSQIPTSPVIHIMESIGVNDSPEMLLPPVINDTENIGVTDSVRILLPVVVRIIETISVTDATELTARTTLPVINYFTASPERIFRGASSTLSWSVTGATTITIDNNIGSVQSIGTRVVKPGLTTTYNMKATNSAGSVKAAVTVTVTIRIF
jgi:hypothetical protein